MPDRTISIAIVVCCAFFGGLLGHYLIGAPMGIPAFVVSGTLVGLLLLGLLKQWRNTSAEKLTGGFFGLVCGPAPVVLFFSGLPESIPGTEVSLTVYAMAVVIFGLMGMQVGAFVGERLLPTLGREEEPDPVPVRKIAGILDTSVIIDGRIADVCETGFLDGDLVIPEFILHELQMIADSSESTKRHRGRRGLDILKKIQKQSYLDIIIDDTDYPSIKEVDLKLIQMAKERGHPIVTNDFNLNKVADVHSLQVLNVNQLANALKPIVLPGETMKVQIIKDGKEPGQGVAYLDDGTMVVVDNGRRVMGRTLEVTVTSVLQTTAGRMIFSAIKS